MPENKTQQPNENVEAFLNTITDEQKRKDSFEVLNMMKAATGMEPAMWGSRESLKHAKDWFKMQ